MPELIFCLRRDDKTKCQTVVDKYVGFAREHGTRSQYRHALEMMLPGSTLFDYMEGRFPNPAYLYTKVVEILEAEEKEFINKQIGERRTRLGAKIGQVTTEVKREALQGSNLEHLYGCIINWTNDDDLRRLYEEKSLQRAYDTLAVLSAQHKEEKRAQVMNLTEGLVILKHPFALAWVIVLEWKDVETMEGHDVGLLREYIKLFPDDGLSKVLKGYMGSEISPFPKPSRTGEVEGEEEEDTWSMTAEDRLILMIEGVQESSKSAMSQRLVGEYYLYLEEHSSAVESAQKARELIGLQSQISGLVYQDNLDAVNVILATALIHHQSPRNHPEARELFKAILKRKPTNSSALIGAGLILEEEEDYDGAADFLDRALKRGPDVKVRAESAWCKALNGDWKTGLEDLEACLPDLEATDIRTKALRSQTLYRIGMCMWNLDASKSARRARTGAYARFLSSLQASLNFAPAYTSLGIYYADYGKDKKRARKCFQKAFELSPSEVLAAQRLARAFADDRDWDLVEVVAQRVVGSGKIRPPPGSKKKGISWPFAALGVCQLNSQDYAKSIVSFQSALRISPEDYHCWVGLGESYHNSGRYIAATKAFEHAQKLEAGANLHPDDTWFSRYMLSNVRRELGDFEEAASGYKDVLLAKPTEFGVAVALLQTHVESAWRSIELGYFGRAANSAVEAITVAADLVEHRYDAFNLWKALGDACCVFSFIQAYVKDFPVEAVTSTLQFEMVPESFEQLAEYDGTGAAVLETMNTGDTPPTLKHCLQAGILSQKRLIHVCVKDIHAQAVAWYNLGWTEYRAHVMLGQNTTETSDKKAPQYLKASVRCFKRAIELEAGNPDFWNALAVVTTTLNPKVAQHAFVRSLYLNDKSARVWTNLGTLYLLQHDHQLANEAFTRAQSADPDYTHAWLGQGILALLMGSPADARSLFTHAFEIDSSSSLLAKHLYTTSTFDHLLTLPSFPQPISLLQPLFALNQLSTQTPSSHPLSHLCALFSERIGQTADATATLTALTTALESDYELSESPASLSHYAQATSDLARAQLAERKFPAAISSADLALDLSTDTDAPFAAAARTFRLSAHLTAGLAHHYTATSPAAIASFRTAFTESESSPDAVCLLAQVLWANGGDEERSVAREQLLDCVEKHPGHAGAIMLLGVIALLDDDADTMDAVAEDLRELRTRNDVSAKEEARIGRVLAALAGADAGHDGKGGEGREMVEVMTAVMLRPGGMEGWRQLGELVAREQGIEEEESMYPRDMALLTAKGAVPPRGELDAEALAEAFAGTGRVGDAQRGVMVAPWVGEGWEGLSLD